MSSEARVRDAVDRSIKQLRELQENALDKLGKSFVVAATEAGKAEAQAARAQAEQTARAELDAALAKARGEAQAHLQAELTKARNDATEARTALERKAAEELKATEARLKGEADRRVTSSVEQVRAEAERERAQLEKEAHERVEAGIAKARADADTALARAVSQVRTEVEHKLATALQRTRAEADRAMATSVENARAAEREGQFQRMVQLAEGVRALDGARSLTEVLDALVEYAQKEVDRVALMVVRGEALQGWRLIGFGEHASDPKEIELRPDDAGVIAEAWRAREIKTSGPELSGFGFAPLPTGHTGLAVPLEVDGQVVAVLYADDVSVDRVASGGTWTEAIEIAALHGARCLQGLMAVRSA